MYSFKDIRQYIVGSAATTRTTSAAAELSVISGTFALAVVAGLMSGREWAIGIAVDPLCMVGAKAAAARLARSSIPL